MEKAASQIQKERIKELEAKPDENSGVAWLDMDELAQQSSEPWFVERIYSKLVNRAKHGIVR